MSNYFRHLSSFLNSSRYCSTTTLPLRRREKDWIRPAKSVKDVILNCRVGESVRIQGWVKGLRKQKKYTFLDISDGLSSHKLPAVIPAPKVPEELNIHTSVDLIGVLQSNPSDDKLLELHPDRILVTGGCDQTLYPLAGKTKYTQDYVRQFIHLRPKTRKFASLLRLRHELIQAMNQFFQKNDFVHIHTPIISSNDAEGAGETFTVIPDSKELLEEIRKENQDSKKSVEELFFDRKVQLTVSGQLHLEAAVGGLGKVWTLSPAFRAENNKSTRHLSEFYMLEAEIAFAYDIQDILDIMEDLVKDCIQHVLTTCEQDWLPFTEEHGELRKLLEKIASSRFTIMTFEEAKKLLESRCNSQVVDNKGLTREQELLLTEDLNDGVPVFVIDWPGDIKPFYMRRCNYDSSKVSAVDLLIPTIGELCGGSLRESNPNILQEVLDKQDPTIKLKQSLQWYLDLRKYGGVPSGGFGLGFERFIQLVTGTKSIRDVTLFPRWAHHCP